MWQRILRGLSAYFSVTLINNLTGVLQAILTLRYLDVAEYGRYTLLLSFFALGRTAFDLGSKGIFVSEIAQANGANQPGRIKGLWRVYGRFITLAATLVTLIFIGLSLNRSDTAFLILGIYAFFFALNFGASTLLLGFTQFQQSAAQQVVRNVSRLLLLLCLPLLPLPNVLLAVLWTHALKEVVTFLFSAYWIRPLYTKLTAAPDQTVNFWHLFKQQGIYLILSYPVRQIIGELPIWLLNSIVGITAVGIYGAARKAFNLVNTLFTHVETVLTPLIPEQMHQNPDRMRVAIRQSQKYTFWLTIGMLIVALPFAPWFIQLLGIDDFEQVIRPFQLLLLTALFTPFIQSHRPLLFALRQQKWLLAIQLLSLATYAPLLYLLIGKFGVLGAMLALLANGIIHTTVRGFIIHHIAPQFWVAPQTIFHYDPFDKQLLQKIRRRLH